MAPHLQVRAELKAALAAKKYGAAVALCTEGLQVVAAAYSCRPCGEPLLQL